MPQAEEFIATGRRKTSVARVRMMPGSGKIDINGRTFEDYFPTVPLQNVVLHPLQNAKAVNTYDVFIHEHKLAAAAKIRANGIPLSLNFVIHRRNIDRLAQMIDLTETLGAERVELANVQFYGWAFHNRAALLPTREQVERARDIATAAKARLEGKIDIFYVLPDYYETRPKPCLNGWGQRYLTVNPIGYVLPCPTASSAIPDLRFENVRTRELDWIWRQSESFNRFRGTEWMPEPWLRFGFGRSLPKTY